MIMSHFDVEVKDHELFKELNDMQIHILDLLDKEIQDFNHTFE